jgi:hypothetical protein
LKSLPSDFRKRWGIYLLVLEKPFSIPRIYIGSGTNALSGVSQRMAQYTGLNTLPKYIKASVDDGYTITHKGLLAWAPIPLVKDMPLIRALFVLLEATLCFVLWAVKSKLGGEPFAFGIRSLCSWAINGLSYTGLCSHNPLSEQLGIDFALSPEDLEALQNERRLNENTRKRPQNAEHHANNISKKRFHCAPCNYSAAHQANLDNHLLSKRHLRKVKSAKAAPLRVHRNESARATNKATKRYYSGPCNYAAVHKQNLDSHLASEKHRKVLLSSSGST